ncbi:MAG: DUF58 domain-containing protein [Planctomycetes bacterium]|nr:DUF58 domain-containing protein [Planctomycetota bacterium]NOG55557.1 DUF58 domain-containing protein [Planctomycetota bacterium]
MQTTIQDYLSPETLARLGTFELRAKMIVEGIRSGMHRSPYHGFSVEFAEHRQYVQGDDIRYLDWKVFGRSDKLYLKQYEQETNQDVVLLVDSSGSMSYGSGLPPAARERKRQSWSKFDHATALAAAIAFLALRQQDRVGLAVFADEVRALMARSSTTGHWRQIVTALTSKTVEAETSILRCFEQVLGKISNRVLFILISDFFDDIEQIKSALAKARHRGHDVILFQTLDSQEIHFDFQAAAPFIGLEGELPLNIDPKTLREAYLEELAEHCRGIEHLSRGFGLDYLLINTHRSLGPVLSQFLARRNARSRQGRGSRRS